jgi:hypothetical protein
LCAAAVEAILSPEGGIDIQRPDVADRLFKLLSHPDPEIVKEAASLCTAYKVPGVESALRNVMAKGQGPIDKLAEELVSCATTPESVLAALPYLFGKREECSGAPTYWNYWRVLENPDPSVSGPLRDALRRYLLTYEGGSRLDDDWVRNLASVADESVVPVLEDILTFAKDTMSRDAALEGLGRVRPREAFHRILQEARHREPLDIPFGLLHRYATEEDSERVLDFLYPVLSIQNRKWIYLEEVQLLLDKLGRGGREFIERNKHRLHATAAEWVEWKLRGVVARDVLADLRSAGVIPETPEELFQRAARWFDSSQKSQPEQLLSALRFSATVTLFDRESCGVPAPHQELIRMLADNSNGQFNPECPVQIWREDKDSREGPCVVQFIYHGKLYRFGAENWGDWYNVQSVIRALNTALENNSQPQRYIRIHDDGQSDFVIFADPTTFLPIARHYALALP